MWTTNNGFSTLLGIYTGSSVNALTQVGSAAFGGQAVFQVTGGTSYQIAVDGYNPSSGSFTLNIGSVIPPPANDAFGARIVLPSGATATAGTNAGATKEPGEPNHGGNAGGKSVWWSWTSPSSGEVTIEVTNSTFYPLIGIYTGSDVAGLVSAGATSGGNTANFMAASGVTYHIAVDTGSMPTGGSFELGISDPVPPAANDQFANRVLLPGTFAKVNGYNNGASKEAGEPNHAGDTGGKSVWYRWISPSNGTFSAYLIGAGTFANYARLAVYTGSVVNALTPVGSASWGTPRTVSFAATAGTEYQIAVDGASWTPGVIFSGAFLLSMSQTAANNAFADAIDLGAVASGSSTSWVDFGANTETGEQGHPAFPWNPVMHRTIWWKWTAPASGLFSFDTLGSDFDTVLEVYTGTAVNALSLVAESHDADAEGRSSIAFQAALGTTYYLRVMGETVNDIGNVALQFSQLGAPGSLADHIRLGRAYLQLQTTASLAAADAQFAAALAIDANHPEANFLKAATGLARLEQGAAFESALAGLGITDGDLYGGGHTIPEDINGDRIATPGTHTSHGLNYLVNTALPQLTVVRNHLDKASAPSFHTTLSDGESALRFVRVDAGDVALMRASTYMLEALIRLLQTYDAGASMADLINQSNTQDLTAESLVGSFSNLLESTGNDQRQALKSALQNANTHYQNGSAFIRNNRVDPGDADFLFALAPENTQVEADARARSQEVSDSLNGSTMVAGETVNLAQVIQGPDVSLRNRLPGLMGNKAVSSTTPDPTFSGAAPHLTQNHINNELRVHGLLYETTSFGSWSGHFLKNLPLSDQLKTADPDGDLINNFAEYAFNLNPRERSATSDYATSGLETNLIDGKAYLNIIYNRRINRPNVSYVVAVSDNLTAWDRTQAQLVQVGLPVPNPDGVTESVQFRVLADPTLTDRKFIRIEVTDLTP